MEAKITQIENKLKRLEKLETSIIEQLDNLTLIYLASLEIENDELYDSLYISFDWSVKTIEKLIHLNEQLINCFEKLKDVPTAAINALNIRIKNE